jgi:metal-sulfur cluster biosynthetic enzyme
MSRATFASPLWIAPAESAAPSACAACVRPAARVVAAPGEVPPVQLLGDQQAAARLLRALRSVHDPESGLDLVDAGWVQALRVDADEAELTLQSRTSGCSVARVLAEDAFGVLRRELPDTDLYIRHQRHPGAASTGRQCLHPVAQPLEA